MEIGNQTNEESSDEPRNPEFEEQRLIRERKENPTMKEKFQKMTFNINKDLPKLSLGQQEKEPDTRLRENEIKNIRQKMQAEKNFPVKDTSPQKSNTGDEIETIVENVNNHAIGVAHSLHDFIGGESRSQQIAHVRGRKNKSRGIER